MRRALRDAGVEDVPCATVTGLDELREFADRVAFCTAVAADRGSAAEAAVRAMETLSVVVDTG